MYQQVRPLFLMLLKQQQRLVFFAARTRLLCSANFFPAAIRPGFLGGFVSFFFSVVTDAGFSSGVKDAAFFLVVTDAGFSSGVTAGASEAFASMVIYILYFYKVLSQVPSQVLCQVLHQVVF